MARQRKFKKAEMYDERPSEGAYSTRCRLCWPGLKEGSSSSDSEDELISRDPVDTPVEPQYEKLYRKDAEAFAEWPA